jgi:hypothetical protein
MPCVRSQVSRRCPWGFHAIPSQNSRFLCNRPEGPLKASGRPTVSRSFSIEDVRTSGQHCPDARSSFSNFYTELDFNRHYLGSFCKTSEWRGKQARKGVTAKIVRMLGQAVRTWTCYGKNCAILERRSQKTVRTRLSSVWTLYSQNLILSRIRFSLIL